MCVRRTFRWQGLTVAVLSAATVLEVTTMPAWPDENPDVQAVLKVAPKAPPLPKPTGKTVRVTTSDQLVRAVAAAEKGTTILLAEGRYDVNRLPVQQDGITIRGESGDREKVVLDGQDRFDRMIVLRGAKDFLLADLTMTNSRQYGLFMLGDSDVQRMRVYNVKFHNIWVRAVKGTHAFRIDDSARNLRTLEEVLRIRPTGGSIRYCLFVNDKVKPYADDGFDGDYVSGMDMMWLKDWTISDNVFIGIRGRNGRGRGAIFIWVNSEDVVAERNIIINCDRGICFGNPSGDPLHMTAGLVRNNFIVAGARQAIEFVRTRNTRAYNNTIFGRRPEYPYTVHFYEGSEGGQFCNNLVHGHVTLSEKVARGSNLVGDFTGWFVDPDVGDLHLTRLAEQALGTGKALREAADDFDGQKRKSPPDVGADERMAGGR